MAVLNVQKGGLSGVALNFVAADVAGDQFLNNDGRTSLIVKNGDAAPHTITVNSITKCNQGFDHDVTVTIAAGSEVQIGPFDVKRFNDSTQKVSVTYDAVTAVTVAAISA